MIVNDGVGDRNYSDYRFYSLYKAVNSAIFTTT